MGIMARRLTQLSVLMVLGAAASIGVAWASAFWIDVATHPLDAADVRTLGVDETVEALWVAAPGSTQVYVRVGSDSIKRHLLDDESAAATFPPMFHVASSPTRPFDQTDDLWKYRSVRLACENLRTGPGVYAEVYLLRHERGWPLRCLASESVPRPAGGWRMSGRLQGISLKPWTAKRRDFASDQRVLPLRPMWPGFVLNTLIFGCAMWMLMMMCVLIRSAIRRRRGRCGACGYDLRGSDDGLCPECGGPIPSPLRGRATEWVGRRTEALS